MAGSTSAFVVPDGNQARLDRLISESIPGLSRRRAQKLIEAGKVRVDGQRPNKSHVPSSGQRVAVELDDDDEARPEPALAIDVVLETPELVVVDKPAGMPSAALRGSTEGTAAGALVSRYPEMAGVGFGPREPGLVHRLDTFTSGLLLAARSALAFTALREALTAGTLDKRYLAIVTKAPSDDEGVLDQPLGPDPKNKRRVRALAAGQPCRSVFRVKWRGPTHCLVEVQASRAYRHQVRAHMALLGSPLVGDLTYGGPAWGGGSRHALHASALSGRYVLGGESRTLSTELALPPDMAELLRADGYPG